MPFLEALLRCFDKSLVFQVHFFAAGDSTTFTYSSRVFSTKHEIAMFTMDGSKPACIKL